MTAPRRSGYFAFFFIPHCSFFALLLLVFVATPAFAQQRMGIAQGNTSIAPNGSAVVSSRCLDEHARAPQTGDAYVKVLTDNPNDITVQVGDADPIPLEQAVREGKIKFTGNDGPGGNRRVGNTIYFDPTRMRVSNLTDQPVVVRVKKFTPIGTARHQPIGYDIGGLSGLSQREVWNRQDAIAREAEAKKRAARLAPLHAGWKAVFATPGAQAGERRELDLGKGVKMAVRWCPAGSFTMGSPSSESGREMFEGPQHRVHVDGFWMAETEVTQAQWEAVMGTNPSRFKGADRPVEQVSWHDATEFCLTLSLSSGLMVSLPTEAQWEYACRAGSRTRFCFGDSDSGLGAYAWYKENSGGKTHPVGGKRPNEFGLYDMHGNVWEWCGDWYGSDTYSKNRSGSLATNPTGPGGGTRRVLRGGSWYNFSPYCRSANRDDPVPDARYYGFGFRVARTP